MTSEMGRYFDFRRHKGEEARESLNAGNCGRNRRGELSLVYLACLTVGYF